MNKKRKAKDKLITNTQAATPLADLSKDLNGQGSTVAQLRSILDRLIRILSKQKPGS